MDSDLSMSIYATGRPPMGICSHWSLVSEKGRRRQLQQGKRGDEPDKQRVEKPGGRRRACEGKDDDAGSC